MKQRTICDGGKYIYFELVDEKPKTQVWDVVNKRSETPLGRISWYGPWRQYVFEPEAQTVYNDGCLNSISSFLGRLRRDRSRQQVML